jgi:lantibiotic modifying enzyme
VLKTHFIPQFESTEINDDIAAILVVSDTSIELDRVSLPLLLNTRIPANDYKIEFIDGFKSAYQELSLSTSVIFNELNHFTGLLARYIPRTTAMYSRLWQSSCQPYYQQSGIKQELHYEKLWLDAKRRPHLSKLINQEKQDMLNADIPFFQHTVGSKDLLVEKRLCVKNYFKQDSLALVREKLAYLSIEDCAAQVKIIERSLNLANPNKVSLIKNNLSIKNENFNWLDQSQSIANIIKEQASVSTHSIFWPVTKYHHTGIYCLDSTNYSLHDGVLGIIHYFA